MYVKENVVRVTAGAAGDAGDAAFDEERSYIECERDREEWYGMCFYTSFILQRVSFSAFDCSTLLQQRRQVDTPFTPLHLLLTATEGKLLYL